MDNLKPKNLILSKNRIIGFRKKKKLCLKCGQLKKPSHECIENYIKSDMRGVEIPKQEEVKPETKTIFKPTTIIELQREFIVLNMDKSSTGFRIELSCITHLSNKYKDYIICIFGDINKHFSISEVMRIKRLTNIFNITFLKKQDKINFLHSSKCLFSYKNDLIEYCKENSINYYIFENDKNVTNILKNVPKLN